jgi:putative transposase
MLNPDNEKFNNKYRIASARLQSWDYSSEGMYFVTICTKNMNHYFGEITGEGKIELSELGLIAEKEWVKTIELRPDMNLDLYKFVVMPNHFHGIINIGQNQYNKSISGDYDYLNKFQPQSKNLASIIRGYKSAVTTFARKNNIEFCWQTRFHDHIIRSYEEYVRISNYIDFNPDNWKDDKF